jgi:AcrR family transcriptional regulator
MNKPQMPRSLEQTPRKGGTAARALECLEEIAQRKGLDDVSMREVASRLGVSLAALQHHYPTKAELFDAFVQHEMDHYRERIGRIAAAGGGRGRFTEILRFMAQETLLVARGGVLAMIEARAHHDEASRQAMNRFMRAYIDVLCDLVAAEFPTLSAEQALLCATLVCAQLEGLSTTCETACARGIDPTDLLEAAVHAAASTPARLHGAAR